VGGLDRSSRGRRRSPSISRCGRALFGQNERAAAWRGCVCVRAVVVDTCHPFTSARALLPGLV
jgi:hypothetical protein